MRLATGIVLALLLTSCGSSGPSAEKKVKTTPKVKITQFYAAESKVPKGLKGRLCYGVENASRLELSPAVEQVWPAVTRCFEIAPAKQTTYTLTAYGEDGSTDKKSVDVG